MIEQQRLPSPGGPESRHRVDVDSKLQVHSNNDAETHHRLETFNSEKFLTQNSV